MSSNPDKLKDQGNEAFKNGDFDEAIDWYSKAIEASPEAHICYSNRSAAFLQKGDAANALADAETCLRLNPDFVKGYNHKGTALYKLKCYDESIAVYTEAMVKFPDNNLLKEEMAKVRLAKITTTANTKLFSMNSSRASMMAYSNKQKQAASSTGVTEFISHTKSALELQIHALQQQLKLINGLTKMDDDQKVHMLFALVDKDNDGQVDARELADALRKRNAELQFGPSIEKAISFVAAFDEDKDCTLSFEEFKSFVMGCAESIGITFHDIAELMILQNVFSESGNSEAEEEGAADAEDQINQAVKDQEVVYDAMADPRMAALFNLFDKDGSGNCDFNEVAIGLFHLTDDMEEATKTAVSVLLMMEEQESRTIDYEQFSRLILSIIAASGVDFADTADEMTLALLQEREVSPEDLDMLITGQDIYEEAIALQEAEREAAEITSVLQHGRMRKLFDLWNVDGDAGICFEELVAGMHKFQAAAGIGESVQEAAIVMIGFDEDEDQRLNPLEFANAMIKYAKAIDVDLHELVNFMCVVTVMDDDHPMEEAFFKAIAPQTTSVIKSIEHMLE